jgi:hypothetical protein
MTWLFRVFQVIFWLSVAFIPLVLDRVVTDFVVAKCMPGSECLSHVMPLLVNIGLISLVARLLLWPLVIWNLVGAWLWRRWRTHKIQLVGS